MVCDEEYAKMVVILGATYDEEIAWKAKEAFNDVVDSFGNEANGISLAEVARYIELDEWQYFVHVQIYFPSVVRSKGLEALVRGWHAVQKVIRDLQRAKCVKKEKMKTLNSATP